MTTTNTTNTSINASTPNLDAYTHSSATLTNGESINRADRVLSAAATVIETENHRSAWSRGVAAYALELIDGLMEACHDGYFYEDDLAAPRLVERELLNGASDWSQYSWGGSALIYDGQIAERLCTPSELKKTRNGERNPNNREQWLDTQARALYQAARIVVDVVTRAARCIC